MNKDLDDRIIPNGEYRDGQNIAVSKSEESDVGALENALGNLSVVDFGGTVIGKYIDPTNDRIIVIATNYTDTSADKLSNFAPTDATCAMYSYYPSTNISYTLVSGNFLNFSKTHPIIGINLIEDLLFWTDNRNQPRKINITTAETGSGYGSEDQISVAKYYPWQPIHLYEDSGIPEGLTVFAHGATYTPQVGEGTTGGSGDGNLTVDTTVVAGEITSATVNVPGTGYVNGDIVTVDLGDGNGQLTVATTQLTTMKDVVSTQLPDPSPATLNNLVGGTNYADGATVVTTAVAPSEGEGLTVDLTCVVDPGPITGIDINQAGHGYKVGDTVDITTGGNDATVDVATIGTANPYLDANWPGDPNFLKDRFVRFSYRFKFDDGEYSLIAPFTQICFVPKQDGYFLQYDEDKTFKSTEVSFMENKINDITLVIDKPTIPVGYAYKFNSALNYLKVVEIDILYKEANSAAIKVVDTIKVSSLDNSEAFTYNYQSQKPIKVLPEREVVRVFDKVPVRALAQEVTGNRVVYANYADKHSPPDTLDYNVNAGTKNPDSLLDHTRIEYQNHTLKQNRTYQVGIILADRYGRQSDVILSSANTSISTTAKISTFYHPYKSSGFAATDIISNSDTWPGDSIKVVFNNLIPSSVSKSGYPGLYDSSTNPLGWYTYKIVVKQVEQDYYNVYFPGILNGQTEAINPAPPAATNEDPVGYMVLTSDNINKIPRDLQEVGPNQNQFRAARPTFEEDPTYYQFDSYIDDEGNTVLGQSLDPNTTDPQHLALLNERDRRRLQRTENAGVSLFGRVTNYMQGTLALNKRINPDTLTDGVVAIATVNDFGLSSGSPLATDPVLYTYQSNPLVGRLELSDIDLGATWNATPDQGFQSTLAVYETEPGVSNLDLFWETSTGGLISELNTNILTSDNTIPSSLETVTSLLNENLASGNPATNSFRALNDAAPLGGASMTLNSVIDGYATNVTGNFTLVSDGGGAYHLQTATGFWYGVDSKLTNYTGSVKVTSGTVISYLDFNFRMANTAPSITDPTGSPTATGNVNGNDLIYAFIGENGSATGALELNELKWEVISQVFSGTTDSPGNLFYMKKNGNLRNYDATTLGQGYLFVGDFDIVVQLTDGGGLTATQAMTVTLST